MSGADGAVQFGWHPIALPAGYPIPQDFARLLSMKKQDWTPRDFGLTLAQALEKSLGDAWWDVIRDYRQCLGEIRFQDWLVIKLRRRAFRDIAVREIKKKMAVPSSRKMDTPEAVAVLVVKVAALQRRS